MELDSLGAFLWHIILSNHSLSSEKIEISKNVKYYKCITYENHHSEVYKNSHQETNLSDTCLEPTQLPSLFFPFLFCHY